MGEYAEKIRRAADCLRGKTDIRPQIGLVLGSGWNILAEKIQNGTRVPYKDVPGMAVSTVLGHAGEWIFGELSGKRVMVMNGRLHYYEGHAMKDITLPVRVMKEMGCEIVVLTNAAGAINMSFHAGDLMLVKDHINITGQNPLFGANDDALGTRFPDMSTAYDPALLGVARATAACTNFHVREGVYAMMTGPSFETPAEIRMLRTLGADAVGMSTVPEVIAARHAGLRVLALSCMTNMAAGVLPQPLSHAEVLATTERVKEPYCAYMEALVAAL